MNDLYPFEHRFFDVGPAFQPAIGRQECSPDAVRMHYLDEGNGDPVVMLHGNPTWSYYYRNLVGDLRDSYRVIAPDHIGCGLSDKPDDVRYQYTLARRVQDLEALLDRLGVTSDITLVLHDWGGMIGMAYATRHPERIARLVILNTAAFHLPKAKSLPWSLRLCRNRLLGPFLVRGLNLFCRGAARYCVTKPLRRVVRYSYLAPYCSWRSRIAVLRFVQDIPLHPQDVSYDMVTQVQSNLDRLKHVPMLICWGERDFVFDGHFLAEWRQRFPEAKVHTFADAGHYVLEDAGVEIAKHVRRFLLAHKLEGHVP